MKKHILILLIIIVLIISSDSTVIACNENQTNIYVSEILFGDKAASKISDENVKMLTSALYLCSQQSDNLGQDKIAFLKGKDVSGVPRLSKLNIKGDYLIKCSHNSWENNLPVTKKKQANRRKVLRNTVNSVFDFGVINNWFGSNSGKCNSFSAILYYTHILADYVADDPSETETNIGGRLSSPYAGIPYDIINGNMPSFTSPQKVSIQSFKKFSPLDNLGRAGVAFANIDAKMLSSNDSRQDIGNIKPSGWNQKKYKEIIGSETSPGYLYNRCHLIAHQLVGEDGEENLITGTDYLNKQGMKKFEDKVTQYIKRTNNHVLYRATPVYKGDNQLASGVQLEAYSVEDSGEGICFNVYFYNVQPGIDINYANGDNDLADTILGSESALPFATYNASDSNPDLMYEMNKHFEILFVDQKSSDNYNNMMGDITSIANEARSLEGSGQDMGKGYIEMKRYQYEYLNVLKNYVPLLLMKEDFFSSTFK